MSSDAVSSVEVDDAAIDAVWSQLCSGSNHVPFDEAQFNEGLQRLGCEVSLEEQEVRLEAFSIAAKENVGQRRCLSYFVRVVCA